MEITPLPTFLERGSSAANTLQLLRWIMQATQPEPKAPRLWASIREALRGSHHHDYTELNLDRAILLLAIPMVLEMSMESLFAIVDAFFVSSLGTDSVAAVALTEYLVIAPL